MHHAQILSLISSFSTKGRRFTRPPRQLFNVVSAKQTTCFRETSRIELYHIKLSRVISLTQKTDEQIASHNNLLPPMLIPCMKCMLQKSRDEFWFEFFPSTYHLQSRNGVPRTDKRGHHSSRVERHSKLNKTDFCSSRKHSSNSFQEFSRIDRRWLDTNPGSFRLRRSNFHMNRWLKIWSDYFSQ